MKVFLIMIFCLQDPSLELENTCLIENTKQQFETVSECIQEINNIRSDLNHLQQLYSTGFCTTKTIQET